MNSECTGCIGRHVTLSLGCHHCDVTMMSNFKMAYVNVIIHGKWHQISKCSTSASLCMVMNTIFKMKHWKSKGMQEKESNMSVCCGQKFPSLGIAVWHNSAKPCDAKQWCPSGWNFLSPPHTHVRFLHWWTVDSQKIEDICTILKALHLKNLWLK